MSLHLKMAVSRERRQKLDTSLRAPSSCSERYSECHGNQCHGNQCHDNQCHGNQYHGYLVKLGVLSFLQALGQRVFLRYREDRVSSCLPLPTSHDAGPSHLLQQRYHTPVPNVRAGGMLSLATEREAVSTRGWLHTCRSFLSATTTNSANSFFSTNSPEEPPSASGTGLALTSALAMEISSKYSFFTN